MHRKKVHKEGAAANLTNNVRATAGNFRTTKHYTMYVTLFRVSCLKSFPRDIYLFHNFFEMHFVLIQCCVE